MGNRMKIRRIKHSGSKRGYFIGFFLPVFIISMLLHLPVHINAADIPRTVSEVADFVLDDRAVISDMGKSWYQGYEPAVYPDTYSDWMILYVPVRSEKAVGPLESATTQMAIMNIGSARTAMPMTAPRMSIRRLM